MAITTSNSISVNAPSVASKLRAEFARAAEIDLSLVHTFFATLLRVYVRPVSRQ